MNLQLFSALRESERRRALIKSMTGREYYDRHIDRDTLTGRDLLWCAVAAAGVFVVVFLGLSL